MAQADATTPRGIAAVEWRIVFSLPLGPAGTALVVFAVMLGSFVALRWAVGPAFASTAEAARYFLYDTGRSALLVSAFIAYITGAVRYEIGGRFRDSQELGLVQSSGDPWQAFEASPSDNRRSRYSAVVGALAGAAMIALVYLGLPPEEKVRSWSDGFAWFVMAVPLIMWLAGRTAYFLVTGSLALPAVLEHEVAVDLVDLGPQRVAGRLAMRGALLWIVGMTLASLLFLTPGLGLLLVPVLGGILVVGVMALVLPVRGVQRAIRAAKQGELALVDRRIRDVRGAALSGAGEEQQRLGGLLAWRGHVAAISEWPFDTGALLRFTLYLLIPIGSWVAGALVERLIDAAME